MRRRAHLFLHVLACAPVAVLTTASLTLNEHALAAQPSATPPQVVVALDPGHGGSADNAHPDQLFDPGAVASNGLLEKDVALDISRRVRTLLEADQVRVVMTRDSDVWMDIPSRSQIANNSGAAVFVSIHLNGFSDPTVGGTVILYPGDSALGFAQKMSDALAHRLGPLGIQDNGPMLRDNWWIHTTMPTVTVEAAYLSNPTEANLLRRDDVRQTVALGIRDGIEAQVPAIAARKAVVPATVVARPSIPATGSGAARSSVIAELRSPAAPGPGIGTVMVVAVSLGLGVMMVMLRRRLAWAVADGARWILAVGSGSTGGGVVARLGAQRPAWLPALRVPWQRRKLRTARRRALLERAARRPARNHSVYDELRF
jgi:N-acetylmuramoyl-L-alanine amidase